MKCNDSSSTFSDVILEFKNEFGVWVPKKQNILSVNESAISEWVESSNIKESFSWVDELIEYSFIIEREFLQ